MLIVFLWQWFFCSFRIKMMSVSTHQSKLSTNKLNSISLFLFHQQDTQKCHLIPPALKIVRRRSPSAQVSVGATSRTFPIRDSLCHCCSLDPAHFRESLSTLKGRHMESHQPANRPGRDGQKVVNGLSRFPNNSLDKFNYHPLSWTSDSQSKP